MTPTISCASPLTEMRRPITLSSPPYPPLPDAIAEHHRPRPAHCIFARADRPADERHVPQNPKELASDAKTHHLFWVAGAHDVHGDLVKSGDPLERAIVRLPVED